MTCSAPDCDRPAFSKGLCAGHLKQIQRGKQPGPLRAYSRTAKEAIKEATFRMWNTEDDAPDAWERAWDRLWFVVQWHLRKRKKSNRGQPT